MCKVWQLGKNIQSYGAVLEEVQTTEGSDRDEKI
jgi:hypothetical protein